MKHDQNCAVVRSGDLRAWCDCGVERPPWYGGNKIPDWYLDRFKPASSNPEHDELPDEIRRIVEQI